MTNTEFTSKELDILIDALDDWEQVQKFDDTIFAMADTIFTNADVSDAAIKEKIQAELERRKREIEADGRQRREVSILLKAKLITIKHEAAIKAAMERANMPSPK